MTVNQKNGHFDRWNGPLNFSMLTNLRGYDKYKQFSLNFSKKKEDFKSKLCFTPKPQIQSHAMNQTYISIRRDDSRHSPSTLMRRNKIRTHLQSFLWLGLIFPCTTIHGSHGLLAILETRTWRLWHDHWWLRIICFFKLLKLTAKPQNENLNWRF